MRVNQPRRRGNVVVMAAVSLVMIVAVTALSVDGGILLDKRRTLQATTDSASLAAAGELYRNYPYFQGSDTSGTARQAALDACAQNGFVDGVNCSITINIPPQSGPFTGLAAHVEVLIAYDQQQFFARIFGTEKV